MGQGYEQSFYAFVEEIDTSCWNNNDCANTQCKFGCSSCSSATSCTACSLGFFRFFQSPNYICIRCPGYDETAATPLTRVDCIECLSRSHNWNLSCASFAILNQPLNQIGSYQVFKYTQSKLYKVKSDPSQATVTILGQVYQKFPYNVQECVNCQDWCPVYNENCFYTGELVMNSKYVTCLPGFFYNDQTQQCQSCGSNCKLCQNINQDNDFKCIQCKSGYALQFDKTCLKCRLPTVLADQLPNQIQNCDECYFGNQNLNFNQDWSGWNAYTSQANALANGITLRCTKCSSNVPVIPSLDLTSCVTCGSNCNLCVYQYEDNSNNVFIQTSTLEIITGSDTNNYFKICKSCENGYFLKYDKTCEQCDISQCQRCFYAVDPSNVNSYNTLKKGFARLTSSQATLQNVQKMCKICNNGHMLSSDYQTCLSIVSQNQNYCVSWKSMPDNSLICLKCQYGFFFSETEVCTNRPTGSQSDNYCNSFFSYSKPNQQNQNETLYLCNECQQGYKPTPKGCVFCGDFDCSSCADIDSDFNDFTDYFIYYQPKYSKAELLDYILNNHISQQKCTKCELKSLLDGVCIGCVASYSCGQCTLDKCTLCPQVPLFSNYQQSSYASVQPDELTCQKCNDYNFGCVTGNITEQIQTNNPYLSSTDMMTIMVYDYSFNCRSPTEYCTSDHNKGDYEGTLSIKCKNSAPYGPTANTYIAYDSKIQQCKVCKNPKGCIKRATFTMFIDCRSSQQTDRRMSDLYNDFSKTWDKASLSDYTVYSLAQMFQQQQSVNISATDFEQYQQLQQYISQLVTDFHIEIYFIPDINAQNTKQECLIPQDFSLFTTIPSLVYHANVKVSLNTFNVNNLANPNNTLQIQMYLQSFISFYNFQELEVNNIDFYPIVEYKPSIKQPFGLNTMNALIPMKITLKKVAFLTRQSLAQQKTVSKSSNKWSYCQNSFQNVQSLILSNVQISNIYFPTDVGPFDVDSVQSDKITFLLTMTDLLLQDCVFTKTVLFSIKSSFVQVMVNSLTINRVQLQQESFIFEELQLVNPNYTVILNNFLIKNSIVNESQLVMFHGADQFKGVNLTIGQNNTIKGNPKDMKGIFESNTFHLTNIKVDCQCIAGQNLDNVLQDAHLFKTTEQSSIDDYYPIDIYFSNVTINNLISKVNDVILFDLKQISNHQHMKSITTLDGVSVLNMVNNLTTYPLSLLIDVENTYKLELFNLDITDNLQINILKSVNDRSIHIKNGKYLLSTLQDYSSPNAVYNGQCFYILNLLTDVLIQNFTLRNLNTKDKSVIKIVSEESLLNSIDESIAVQFPDQIPQYVPASINITIKDVVIENLQLTLASNDQSMAPIDMFIFQQTKISIEGVTLRNIVIRSIDQLNFGDVLYDMTATILIDAVISQALFEDLTISNISSLNTQVAILAQVSSATFRNSNFQNSNDQHSGGLLANTGGFINVKCATLLVVQCQFTACQANQAGAINYVGLKTGIVEISQSNFTNIKTFIHHSSKGYGGVAYLDFLQTTQPSKLIFNSNRISNVFAETTGGLIELKSSPKSFNLTFHNNNINDVFSAGSVYMVGSFQSQQNTVNIKNNVFIQNQTVIESFISSLNNSYNYPKDDLILEAFFYSNYFQFTKAQIISENNQFINMSYYTLYLVSGKTSTFFDNSSEYRNYLMFTSRQFDLQECMVTIVNVTISATNFCYKCYNDQFYYYMCTTCFYLKDAEHYVPMVDSLMFINKAQSIIDISNSTLSFNNLNVSLHGLITIENYPYITINNCFFLNSTSNYGQLYISQDAADYESEKKSSQIGESTLLQRRNRRRELNSQREPFRNEFIRKEYSQKGRQLLQISKPLIELNNVQFIGNKAMYGGGLFVFNAPIQLLNCLFSSNEADEQGGGAFAYYSTTFIASYFTFFKMISSTIQTNKASIGGGVMVEGISPYQQNTIFSGNVATIYGGNLITFPKAMHMIVNSQKYISSNNPVIQDWASGQSHNPVIEFQLIDSDGQVMKIDTTESAEIQLDYPKGAAPLGAQVGANTKVDYNFTSNSFYFEGAILIYYPQQTIKFRAFTSAVKRNIFNGDGSVKSTVSDYYFQFQVQMRQCKRGEAYIRASGICFECTNGTYSLDEDSNECKSCPLEAVECPGKNVIVVKPGFWRIHNNSDDIEHCTNLEQNCLGGTENFTCAEGHIGALCEACDIHAYHFNESYSVAGDYTCGKCSQVQGNVIKIILVTLWTLISMAIAVRSTIQLIRTLVMVQCMYRMGIYFSQKTTSGSQGSILLKVFTNYIQIVSTLTTFQLDLPQEFGFVTSNVGNPVQTMSFSMDCFFKEISPFNILYFRLAWALFMPLVYFVAFMMLMTSFFAILRYKMRLNFVYNIVIYLLMYFQPNIVQAFIAVASCRKITGVFYIKADVAQECYTTEHLAWLLAFVIPAIGFWIVVVPGFMFRQLFANRDKLDTLDVKFKYGFLFNEYAPRVYFWEIIKMYQKILIIIILSIFYDSVPVKGLIVYLVVFLYGSLALRYKPYHSNMINSLDDFSTIVCALSIVLGVFIYQNPYSFLVWASLVIIMLINIALILSIFRVLFAEYLSNCDLIMYNIAMKVFRSCPAIQKRIKPIKFVPEEVTLKNWNKLKKYFKSWIKARKEDKTVKFFDLVKNQQMQPGKLIPEVQSETLINGKNRSDSLRRVHPQVNPGTLIVTTQQNENDAQLIEINNNVQQQQDIKTEERDNSEKNLKSDNGLLIQDLK